MRYSSLLTAICSRRLGEGGENHVSKWGWINWTCLSGCWAHPLLERSWLCPRLASPLIRAVVKKHRSKGPFLLPRGSCFLAEASALAPSCAASPPCCSDAHSQAPPAPAILALTHPHQLSSLACPGTCLAAVDLLGDHSTVSDPNHCPRPDPALDQLLSTLVPCRWGLCPTVCTRSTRLSFGFPEKDWIPFINIPPNAKPKWDCIGLVWPRDEAVYAQLVICNE